MSLFGTAGIRGDAREDVDPELALAVGRAAARHAEDAFVVGYDGRETSPALADAVGAGLASGGAPVERVGRVPTPALAFASRGRHGVMITASHNPPGDNGIKLFEDGVEYDADAEAAIEERVEAGTAPVAWDGWQSPSDGTVLDRYRDAVASYVRERFPDDAATIADTRVALDCGNGVAGLATPQVLRALGADPVALNANVDGSFPARESKPTAESLTALRQFVAEDDATGVGIGHDGDGDRLVVVGPDGGVVHEDTVLAVIAERYVRASDAGDPVVVTTPNASGRIDDRVADAGGRVERVALGSLHEGIARERAAGDEGTEVVFAAEPWKHVHPDFGGWIDAVVSAAVVTALAAGAGSVPALTARVEERPYKKQSVPCPDPAKAAVMETVEEVLPGHLEAELAGDLAADPASGEAGDAPTSLPDDAVDTEYGVRVTLPGGGWVLVRPSGTEPYVRIYAEHDAVDDLVTTVRTVVENAVAAA